MKSISRLAYVFICLIAALTGCTATRHTAQAFPDLDANLQKQQKAGYPVVYPVLKHAPKPVYPSMPASGSVWSVMKVGPNGTVQEVRIIGEAPDDYRQSIQRALMEWRFQPGTISGKPATFPMQVKIIFAPHAVYKAQAQKADDGITFVPEAVITKELFPKLYNQFETYFKEGRRVTRPRPLKISRPKYSKGMPAEGMVWVAFVIDELGWARDIHIIGDTPKEFKEAISQAMVHWQFEPATVDGKRHAHAVAAKMTFRLVKVPGR